MDGVRAHLILNDFLFLKFCVVILSVELHRPSHHGGADLHRFPAAVVRVRDQPACSHPAAPALWVRSDSTVNTGWITSIYCYETQFSHFLSPCKQSLYCPSWIVVCNKSNVSVFTN